MQLSSSIQAPSSSVVYFWKSIVNIKALFRVPASFIRGKWNFEDRGLSIDFVFDVLGDRLAFPHRDRLNENSDVVARPESFVSIGTGSHWDWVENKGKSPTLVSLHPNRKAHSCASSSPNPNIIPLMKGSIKLIAAPLNNDHTVGGSYMITRWSPLWLVED